MIGKRLKELRLENQLTQYELGKIVNKTKNNISQYETEKRQPDNDVINQFADYFNVSIDYLFGRTNDRRGYIVPEGNLHKDNIFFKSYDEIYEHIKKALYENGVIPTPDTIPPEIMETIVKHGLEAATEILKARKQKDT